MTDMSTQTGSLISLEERIYHKIYLQLMQDIPGQLRNISRAASVAGTRQEELPNSKNSFPSITESNVEAPREKDKAIKIDDDSYNVVLCRQRAAMRGLIYMEKDTISDCTRNAYNAAKIRNEVDGESPSAN
ncbi:hypothetical protein HHI36_004721 [Cryptolaemus montrouzieri]|uniref:Uncharacterized protein n=1 Tax=Cryptolaemus montrouzieri TaxID=559131 RepID=A0ABD2NSN8_9CUCU